MGNKQSNNQKSEQNEKKQDDEIQSIQSSTISTTQTLFSIENSRNTQLQYSFYDDSPAKINTTINGITFWSNYDSGNLSKVEIIDQDTINLSIAGDCQERNPKLLFNKGARIWFNFKVRSDEDKTINFAIINIATRFKTIWQYDSDIYVKIDKIWQRYPAVYQGFQVKFTITLSANIVVQFAYVPPWSYKKNLKYLDLYSSYLNPDIYFRREVVAKSLEGRNIELITMTKQAQHEKSTYFCTEYLFPEKHLNDPPVRFNKRYILITCRVHAAEVPASHVLKGILEQFKEYNDTAKFLLENYVFLIIPMMNPDGVYRGHYRLDCLGYDQNRVYNRLVKYPKFNGPLAVLEIVKHYDVALYIDLHAHSTLTNSFIFTNWNPDPQIQSAILEFPKQMKQLVGHFRLKEALSTELHYEKSQYEFEGNYTEQNDASMNVNLQIHKLKEDLVTKSPSFDNPFSINPYLTGVGKSDVYLTTNTLCCYTLEINYRVYVKNKQVVKYEVADFVNLGKDILVCLENAHTNQNFIRVVQMQNLNTSN